LKRTLKLSISLIFFAASWVSRKMGTLFGIKRPGRCIAIYYHVVRAREREEFAWQMDELLKCSRPLAANSHAHLEAGKRYSIVTFDDGYLCAFENAVPELLKREIPVTIFMATDALGQRPNWSEYGSDDGNDLIISAQELCKARSPFITIGTQTMSHPVLTKLSDESSRRELQGSKAFLEELLQREVKLMSFPYGAFGQRHLKFCREAGYERVFTTIPSFALKRPDEFTTCRVRVDPTDWRIEFRLKLRGAYSWLPGAFELKRQLQSAFSRDKVTAAMSEEYIAREY
jgi:peptidoglycan/xylan/chitin deacetylase (PgdA/CDA1 family)